VNEQQWKNHVTREFWEWITSTAQEEKAREYTENRLAMALGGKVRLTKTNVSAGEDGSTTVGETRSGDQVTQSLAARSLLATGLARGFGEDAPDDVYDLDTWAGHLAYRMSLAIDWHQIAGRLLERYTLEYLPSDAK
jgi:hypothetical protein